MAIFSYLFKILSKLLKLIWNQLGTKTYIGVVTKIYDGDTILLQLESRRSLYIRLSNIDAPEANQPFGAETTKALSQLCLNKKCIAISKGKSHNRIVATLFHKNNNLNLTMVKLGMAWAIKKYPGSSKYLKLQKKAQHKKIGLWKQKKPTPPWVFRKY